VTARPSLLVVFYADPDRYPPTYSAVCLLAQHFRVRIICRKTADPPSVTWPEGVRVDRIGLGGAAARRMQASHAGKIAEFFHFAWAVRSALAAERPRLVYAYESHALVTLRLGGCQAPIVYHRHDLEELGPIDRRSLGGWALLWARRLGRSADLVVMPEKQRLIDYQRFVGDDRPGIVVPNFPLRASFPPPDDWRRVFEERARQVEVLFRGGIGRDNGVLEIVRAIPHLDRSISLRLCGEAAPDFLRQIEALAAELGVADRVRYDGYVPYPRLNRETLRASVGVALYRPTNINLRHSASAANKLYEYAACGVPIIVPDQPSLRSFLAGEPWVAHVDAHDPADVARAIEALISTREGYEARCLAARRAFEERFNYDVVFQPLLSTILALAAERPPSGAGPDA